MKLDGTAGDGQPDAAAAVTVRAALVDLEEGLEQLRQGGLGYARTCVLNHDANTPRVLRQRHFDHGTLRRESNRVADDVLDRAVQQAGIDVQREPFGPRLAHQDVVLAHLDVTAGGISARQWVTDMLSGSEGWVSSHD